MRVSTVTLALAATVAAMPAENLAARGCRNLEDYRKCVNVRLLPVPSASEALTRTRRIASGWRCGGRREYGARMYVSPFVAWP
jgi:hypothetical protein